MEDRGEGRRRGRGVNAPLRILLSAPAARRLAGAIDAALAGRPHLLCTPDEGDADIAFVTREVTGLSTKHETLPETQRFYDALAASARLRWVQVHSAGADRPIYRQLLARGVQVATGSGANGRVVAHSALAGLLALARRLPQQWQAQRAHAWEPLLKTGLPRDLEGQHAVLVGWGPIGQHLGALLQALGLRVTVVRQQDRPAGPGYATVPAERLPDVLGDCDWLVLVCPLTERTRGLVDAEAIARLPARAQLVNVSRGEVVDEPALVEALRSGRLAGAYLDVFAHEPLAAHSPLWDLPNVIATPHSAGFSDGNEARVDRMFIDNLRRWVAGEGLHKLAQ